MKTMQMFAVALVAAAPLFAHTEPKPAMLDGMVTVTGEATVTTPPDEVMFTAGVQTTAQTVDVAVRENNEHTARVIAALKKAGASDAEIRTSNFNIWPMQDYAEGRPPRITGFTVSNQVTVTKKDPAAASKLLTAAVEAGANNVSGLSMGVSNMDRIRAEGLRRAFENARQRAETLAKAANRTLGPAVAIREGIDQGPVPPPMFRQAMAMEAKQSMDVPVEAGSSEVRFVVTVSFDLK